MAPGCLVRLLKYSVEDMAGRKIVIVIDLEVAAGPQKLIGAPTGYPHGEALPSVAQPAGGGTVRARFWLKKVVEGECAHKYLGDKAKADAAEWLRALGG